MVSYTDSLAGVTVDHLAGGFFVSWPQPPTPATHLRLLEKSAAVVLARTADGRVVGFVTAITDHVSCVYLPHLEVLPSKGSSTDMGTCRRKA